MVENPAPDKRRRIYYRPERETLADHFFAGLVSAVVMLVMVIIGPLLAALSEGMPMLDLYWVVHIWGPILMGVAFFAGLIFGPRKMAELWGHLWGTEEPENETLSSCLWFGIVLIVGITWVLT